MTASLSTPSVSLSRSSVSIPAEPPAWVQTYFGLEFKDLGRDRRGGVDCWGLVRLVYSDRFGIHLPSYTDGYQHAGDVDSVSRIIRDESASSHWEEVASGAERIGDVAVFTILGNATHVGVVVARGRFLHCSPTTGVTVERYDDGMWRRRLVGFRRYSGGVQLTHRSQPFPGVQSRSLTIPAGGTILELLASAEIEPTPDLVVMLGDRSIPRARWVNVRPKPGRSLIVASAPRGGGGGKQIFRIVASIAIIAAAVYLGPLAAGAFKFTSAGAISAFTAGIGIAGQLLLSALIPPPSSKIGDGSSIQRFSIAGARNRANQYGRPLVVLGEHRIAPPYGALPFTEVIGDDQYLRLLFCCGYGGRYGLAIDELKIGATPIDEFEGVEYEVREGRADDPPLRLWSGSVYEDSLTVALDNASGWQTRTSQLGAAELSVDFTWPQGLAKVNSDGSKSNLTVAIEVEYAPTGSGAWVQVNQESPINERQFDLLFRTPETTLGGKPTHPGSIDWGSGGSNAKPGYLPADNFSWEAVGWLKVTDPGVHEFGIDGTDALQLRIDGNVVASRLSSGPAAGNLTTTTGSITLSRGYHKIEYRMETRSGTGGGAVLGWKQPFDGSIAVIPGASLARKATGSGSGTLDVRWFDTSVYTSSVGLTANRTDQIRKSLSWAVEPGQYDIRVRRVTPDTPADSDVDSVIWTALRTHRTGEPITLQGMAVVALRIKATDQLNGVVDEFNCRVRSIVQDWDAESGAWIERASSNPASLYRHVLQGPMIRRPAADLKLDIPQLEAFHEDCEVNGYTFNAVYENEQTVYGVLQDICSAGRAAFAYNGDRYSVVMDRVRTTPVQIFTPRNSFEYQGSKSFTAKTHALRVRFLNAAKDYQQDERIVFADGYDASNATIYEPFDLFGITDADLAWRHGRFFMATAQLRPERHEISVDFEHLVCTRGDMVLFQHDVPLIGQTACRVRSRIVDGGGDVIGLGFDEPVTMDSGGSYYIRARRSDGTMWGGAVATVEGIVATVTLAAPESPSSAPGIGDLVVLGPVGVETREMIVLAIDHDRDLRARITLIDHAPAIHSADTGTIPPWDSGITSPPAYENRPEAPVIESIRSDDYAMRREVDGSLSQLMVIRLRRPSGRYPIATAAQVRIRPRPLGGAAPSGPWIHKPMVPIDDNSITVDGVEAGKTYDIRLRTLTPDGRASVWVDATHTIVGKIFPPPDVQSFDVVRLSDGTRRYSWDLGTIPPDVAGVVIRYSAVGALWSSMTPLHAGVLEGASPTEINAPEAGTWDFAIKMVDTSGNESVNELRITRTLGPAAQSGVAVLEDAGSLFWPGVLIGCQRGEDGSLESTDLLPWSTLTTWDAWTRWVRTPITPISYTHTIDAGFAFNFEPAADVAGDGDLTLAVEFSVDGATWTAPAAITEGVSVHARFVRFTLTCSVNGSVNFPRITRLVMKLRAPTIEQVFDNLNTAAVAGPRRLGVGDIRLPLAGSAFSVVRSVVVTFNGTGAGWSSELLDKNLSLGPRVRIYNPSDQPADAVVDVVVKGL